MRWTKRKKDDTTRAANDAGETYESKLASRMRALSSTEFDDAGEVEARIRRMSYGAKIEHRPAWMEADEWERRSSA